MNKLTLYSLLLSCLLAISCEERVPALFEDIEGVYFNNTSGSMTVTDSIDLTFVYESSDELAVPVRVQLVGRPAAEDRPVSIRVTSDNAVEGVDYFLPQTALLESGAAWMDYMVTLRRTPALKTEKKMLLLEICENEHFTLPVTSLVQSGDTVSVLSCRIYFSDMFTKAPSAWEENLVGDFTQQKFELICRVLEIDPDDFNDPSVITLAKLLYISAEMTDYVQEQKQKKDAGEQYDTEAFDPQTGEPLNFR